MEKCPNNPNHWWQALALDGRTVLACVHCGMHVSVAQTSSLPEKFSAVPFFPAYPTYPVPPYWGWGEYPLVPSPVVPWYVPKITYSNGTDDGYQSATVCQQ